MPNNFEGAVDSSERKGKGGRKNLSDKAAAGGKPSLELYKPPVLRNSQRKARNLAKCNKDKESKLQKGENIDECTSSSANFQEEQDELLDELKQLLGKEPDKVGQFLSSKLDRRADLAHLVGQYMVKFAVEDAPQHPRARRGMGQVIGQMGTEQSEFLEGALVAIERYWECRGAIRNSTKPEHWQVWTNLLSLVFELGAQHIPHRCDCDADRLSDLIFAIFDYLFNRPVLCSLQLSELELALSALMILGRFLELEHPDRMGELKALLRDAFLEGTGEGWARKMMLLMVELGARGWKLSPDLEQYYFH